MKVLGFTEDFTTCDRCGKPELKGTYAVENGMGNIFYLGSSCIAKKFEMEDSEVRAEISRYKREEKNKTTLNALLAENRSDDYQKRKIIAFMEKKKMDVREFVKTHGTIVYENDFFTMYSYGQKNVSFNK